MSAFDFYCQTIRKPGHTGVELIRVYPGSPRAQRMFSKAEDMRMETFKSFKANCQLHKAKLTFL
jgi:hypothetical protein